MNWIVIENGNALLDDAEKVFSNNNADMKIALAGFSFNWFNSIKVS